MMTNKNFMIRGVLLSLSVPLIAMQFDMPDADPAITQEDVATYRAARRIGEIVLSRASALRREDGSFTYNDKSMDMVDPLWNKVSKGLLLGIYYNVPVCVYTRWGKWQFIQDVRSYGDLSQRILPRLLAHITIQKDYTTLKDTEYVVPISRVENIDVPELEFLQCDPWNTREKLGQWQLLTSWYDRSKKHEKKREKILKARL